MTLPGRKELILINPRPSSFLFNFIQQMFQGNPVPHALLTLAALTPKEYTVRIINQKLFWSKKDFTGGALVGITCLTSAVSQAYQLADSFRQAGSRVVLGGVHVTALPEEALAHADGVVLGEAESVWGQVLGDYQNNRLQKTYKGEPAEDFFTPVLEYYLKLNPVVLSRSGIHIDRGCRYHCEFCARISHWLRWVKIEQVVELLKRVMVATRDRNPFVRRPLFRFACDNIYSDPSYAKELFKKMIPLNIPWGASSSVDIGFDEEALRLAKASGCWGFLIGFETIYPDDYKKTSLSPLRSVDDYRTAINNIRAHGMNVVGAFIIGLDEYTHLDYLKLLWFLIRAGLWHFHLTILTPFPGSALFARLKKENRILSFDWRKYFFLTCVIKPKRVPVFAVYGWFWFIRAFFTIFSFQFLLMLFSFFVSYAVAHNPSRYF